MKSKFLLVPSLGLILTSLVGCGRSLNGTYTGTVYGIQAMSAEFKPGGKVFVSNMGGTTEGTYTFEGDKVILSANGQNQVFTLASDGSLTGGPMGVSLVKKN